MPMAGPGPQLLVSVIPPIAGVICTSTIYICTIYMYTIYMYTIYNVLYVLGELLRGILGSIVESHLNSVQWTPFLSKFSKCHRSNAFQTHSVCESKAMPSLTSCPALRAFLVLTKTAGHTCPASLDYFADDYLMPEFFCSPHPEPIQEDLANWCQKISTWRICSRTLHWAGWSGCSDTPWPLLSCCQNSFNFFVF